MIRTETYENNNVVEEISKYDEKVIFFGYKGDSLKI